MRFAVARRLPLGLERLRDVEAKWDLLGIVSLLS